jgi:hypothetical protein
MSTAAGAGSGPSRARASRSEGCSAGPNIR